MHRLIIILLFLFPLSIFAQHEGECDCTPPGSAEEAALQADIVFTGKVIEAIPNWVSGGEKLTFEVSQLWKQEFGRYMVVNMDWGRRCGYPFEKGKEYLVYATRKRSIKTHKCSGSKSLADAAEDLAFLGAGKPPRKTMSPTVAKMAWAMTIMCILGMVFVAVVVLRKKFIRKPTP